MNKHKLLLYIEYILPWLTLLLILSYSVFFFLRQPYLGFFTSDNKLVVTYDIPSQQGEGLIIGDTLVKVNGITQDQMDQDLSTGFFNHIRTGDRLDIVVERDGQQKNIQYTVPGPNPQEVISRLNSNWVIPYIFWLAGSAALLFLRPRNMTRLLFAAFCYITSVWLSAGLLSGQHLFGAALLLRSAIWISLPIYLHLHWLFPTSLKRLPVWAWAVLYGFGAVMALASWMQWVPAGLYMVGFLLALVGSISLMIAHAISQPHERRALSGIIGALGIVIVPAIVVTILEASQVKVPLLGMVILGLAALPGFYFFTLYRRQFDETTAKKINGLIKIYVAAIAIGLIFCVVLSIFMGPSGVSSYYEYIAVAVAAALLVIAILSFAPFLILPALANEQVGINLGGGRLNFSANRAAAGLFFILLESIAALLLVLVLQAAGVGLASPLGMVLVILAVSAGALAGYPPFRRWFERLALGMKLVPESLMSTYSERITTSLQTDSLRRLLLDEVLPSLLVRQFAQVKLQNGTLQPHILLRVDAGDLPAPASLAALDAAAGQALPLEGPPGLPAWVRLALPLRVANETRGYWLLGQRDPDNQYPAADVELMKTLADQTALALVNIEQAENLQAFYFADIGRNEAERTALAAELHDDVLNQMAVINNHLPEDDAASQQAYAIAVARIRDIINGLRPAMLNYGLYPALQTLADDLTDRLPDGPKIVLTMPASQARYARDVELSFFRIAQQACSNAIQHANCTRIEIGGSLADGEARLTVQDDGRGFETSGQTDLATLLAGRHFGLVGMYERAALIGAELRINSAPGQGSRVEITWLKK